MIIHKKGEHSLTCDECGHVELVVEKLDDFNDWLVDVMSEGWRSERDETGAWVHVCPDCDRKNQVVVVKVKESAKAPSFKLRRRRYKKTGQWK